MDAILVQVPSKRSRNDLIPIIENNCKEGTVFCSDGCKAYHNLVEHMNLADCLHFPVNHTENYVNPETGAHTQTVEGMRRQVKAFLPNFGFKPGDLNTYIGTFLWLRYTKQRKLDKLYKFTFWLVLKKNVLLNNFDYLKHKSVLILQQRKVLLVTMQLLLIWMIMTSKIKCSLHSIMSYCYSGMLLLLRTLVV